MAVLKGEGRVPILFGTWALPVPPNRTAYIARPDIEGEFATVVIAHDAAGMTPGVKAISRHLARHGYSVIVPDLARGPAPNGEDFEWSVSDLEDAVDSVRIPGMGWASQARLALLGIGAGGLPATIVAASDAGALVLAGAVLDEGLLAQFGGALLVLHGGDDELATADELRDLRSSVGRGEWVLYSGVGSGYFDEGSGGFDAGAADDTLDRIVGFLDHVFGVIEVG